MIYDGQEDLHMDMHFQAYCQVDLIEIKLLSSQCHLYKTMRLDEGATVHAFSENLSQSSQSHEDVYLEAYASCQCGYSELSDDAFEGVYHFYLDGVEASAKVRTAILAKDIESKHYEIHHINKLKNLKGKEQWEIAMLAKRRKTLVVCERCHHLIHNK